MHCVICQTRSAIEATTRQNAINAAVRLYIIHSLRIHSFIHSFIHASAHSAKHSGIVVQRKMSVDNSCGVLAMHTSQHSSLATFHHMMARYSLFVLKMALNPNQSSRHNCLHSAAQHLCEHSQRGRYQYQSTVVVTKRSVTNFSLFWFNFHLYHECFAVDMS